MSGRATPGRPGASWVRRPWLWVAAGIVALAFGNSGFRRLVTRWWELRRLQGELKSLEEDRSRLESRLSSAERAGPELERAARRDLGYLRPGEVEYRFPKPHAPPRGALRTSGGPFRSSVSPPVSPPDASPKAP